jgi:bifunctional oligoribonuclease and PAP phosphatase NrnA
VNYSEIKSQLSSKREIVITTHKSPDGDAMGSSLALAQVLKDAGHNVNVMVPDVFPKFLNWMEGCDQVIYFDQQEDECSIGIQKAEMIFSLDYNQLDRVGPMGKIIESAEAIKIMIDHHLFPDKGFDYVISDTSASSCAELVFDFISNLGFESFLKQSTCESLYAGIMTDTGSFRFSSTGAKTHRIAAELIDRGLIPNVVHEKIYDTNSINKLRLTGFALENKLEYFEEKKVAVIGLELSSKNRFGYQKGDTEGLVNYGLTIDGCRMAIFLSEELNCVKFSLRSKGEIDVNLVARKFFNGGGHKNAAGGKLDINLKSALELVKKVIQDEL